MLSLSRVKEYCREAFKKAGYNFDDYNIPVSFNGRLTKTLGRCKYQYVNGVCKPTAIEFSKQLIETSTDESVIDVIYHECAHALVDIETSENHGHDAVFKAMCKRIGAKSDGTTTGVELVVAETEVFKYFVSCPDCGQIVGKYHRAGQVVQHPDWYRCKCGGHNLQVIQNF